MGESDKDRDELILAIASLAPSSVPINFFHPNSALPIKENNLTRNQALQLISKTRETLGEDSMIMVAGGRELMFSGYEKEMFEAGANSIVIGDYLTTNGAKAQADIEMIKQLGYKVANSCDTK
jgi:biotin synthase